MNIDYNRLHIFYQIYRHESIVKAAEELFVTQSALSQNLQKLEQELNITLFHRFPKRLVPTPAAEELFKSILPFFATIDSNITEIRSRGKKPQGLLRIGAPPIFGASFLPRIIARFRHEYPLVNFSVVLGDQHSIVSQYRNSSLDIALVDIFGNREEDSWNLLLQPLVDEPLVLIGSSEYLQKQKTKNGHDLQMLLQCQYIAYTQQAPELHDWFRHHFDTQVKDLDIVLTVENVHAVLTAVRCNLGLGIVPLYLVVQEIEEKRIVPVSIQKDNLRSRISILRYPGKKPEIAEKLFIDMLKYSIRK